MMIGKEDIEDYCLSKEGSSKEYPFDETTAVFKVGNKMFALFNDEDFPVRINLKCNPFYAMELRKMYPKHVIAGYHMSKKHWNTIICDESVDTSLLFSWIDDSYELVFNGLSKKMQAQVLTSS